MAGSTTVTANGGARRKTPARSKVRFGWRKRRAMAIRQAMVAQERLTQMVRT
jgi:hypothetical protein